MPHLLLVRHAATAATGRHAFPAAPGVADCPGLEQAGREDATLLAGALPSADRVWSSPARRCLETAKATGLAVDEILADLAECDFGRWAGRTASEIHATDPGGLGAWYADPDAAPHGGERLSEVRARAAAILARAVALEGTTVALTSGGFVRAALLEVLDLPADAVWRLDVAPASVTELRCEDASAGWRVTRLSWTPSLASRGLGTAVDG